MGYLPVNHNYLPKIILVGLIIEILASIIFFMIGKTWSNNSIYVPVSQYVPMSQHVPVGQYVPPMMGVNINRLLSNNHQANLMSPQMRVNKSQLSRGTTRKYRTIFRPQNVYFPGDTLPEKQLDVIRNSSDTKLKRVLTYKQYDVLKNMLEEVVQMFIKDDIR
jgi:hypothetical protein